MESSDPKKRNKGQNRVKGRQYTFDTVKGPSSTQEEIFETTVLLQIERVVQGINISVFAYGCTGAGKTYT